MSPIEDLPNLRWSEQARREIVLTGKQLVEASDVKYRIGNVAVAGLIYRSLTSPPWMWFGLAEGTTLRDLIDFRRLQDSIPHGTLTAVEENFKQGKRFATFYGFEPTEEVRVHNGCLYRIYRRA